MLVLGASIEQRLTKRGNLETQKSGILSKSKNFPEKRGWGDSEMPVCQPDTWQKPMSPPHFTADKKKQLGKS